MIAENRNVQLKLKRVSTTFAICRFDPAHEIPNWVFGSRFFSIARTLDELSVVCEAHLVPDEVRCEKPWKAFQVEGPLDFGLTGVLASLANPLAEAKISIFAISTFDTDYVLVKSKDIESAVRVLQDAGHSISHVE